MVDIHSHVLPGIDDGAKKLEDSVELLRLAAADGVQTVVATPHVREPMWPNRRDGIESRLFDVRAALAQAGVAIEVVLGAEIYFASDVAAAVREGAIPTYGDRRRYLLLELPNHFILRQVQQLVFDLRTAGLTPVVAHPERNPSLMASLEGIADLVRMGALMQVTAMSVTGHFGRGARRAAETLIDRGLVHAVASDGHHARFRPTRLAPCRDRLTARYGPAFARTLLVDNPAAIVAGDEVESLEPALPPARAWRRWLGRVVGA